MASVEQVVGLGFSIVVPAVDHQTKTQVLRPKTYDPIHSGPRKMPPSIPEAIILVWLFALGAAIGSFLNVVIYRLPAGLSLSRPASHCPACKHTIRWYDNVPMFGWVWLGGRCRDCGTRISPRYPIVEVLTAGLFLLVGLVEGFPGGANLPRRPVCVADGWIYPDLNSAQVAGIVAWHLMLLTTLLAAAGIQFDGHRPPWRLYLPALAVGLLAPLGWPHLHPVPLCRGFAEAVSPAGGHVAGLLDSLAGLGMGSILSAAIALGEDAALGFRKYGFRTFLFLGGGRFRTSPSFAGRGGGGEGKGLVKQDSRRLSKIQGDVSRHPSWTSALGPAAACVGLYLGWQAIAFLAATTWVLRWLSRSMGRWWPLFRGIPSTAWLALVTLIWILFWGAIVRHWPVVG